MKNKKELELWFSRVQQKNDIGGGGGGLIHFENGRLPPKAIFSFLKGRLPLMFISNQRPSTLKGCLQSKVKSIKCSYLKKILQDVLLLLYL